MSTLIGSSLAATSISRSRRVSNIPDVDWVYAILRSYGYLDMQRDGAREPFGRLM